MTWLGKILTFLVLLGSVVWAFFTVQAYVTRTNWKTEAERYKTAFRDVDARRIEEYNRNRANEEALKNLLKNERQQIKDMSEQIGVLTSANKKSTDEFLAIQDELAKGDVKAVKLQANNDATLKELDTVRARNSTLEERSVLLIVEAESSKREMVRALNAAKLAQAIADDNARKVEDLVAINTELRRLGGGGPGSLLKMIEKTPPPVLANLHGHVEEVGGDLIRLSIGIDAGLSKGTILDVYRLEGGGRYLGKVKITELYPKQSIGVFLPSRSTIPVERLRPEELPKKGDEVRPQESLSGSR